MNSQHAYHGIGLDYGGNAVVLRPSLRAAINLERLHGGFPALLRKVSEFDTFTVVQMIKLTAAEPNRLLAYSATRPLAEFAKAVQIALFDLVAALMPTAPEGKASDPASRAEPWANVFHELYKIATGWLGWSPDAAWQATPQEISDAFEGHISKLKLIHGGASEGASDDTVQRDKNISEGFDPDFDRAGLASLKGIAAQPIGSVV